MCHINSFQIEKFRCFENFSIGPFERINLIVGSNGIGKTTLLREIARAQGGTYLSPGTDSAEVDIKRFIHLDTTKREQLVSILKIIEPRLKGLSVFYKAQKIMIGGDIGIGETIPLALMGQGMVWIASVTLAITGTKEGIVLVDELETALRHSVVVDVWRALAQVVREADVQFFATTHRWEFIQAAHEAFWNGEIYDFRLHRLRTY